MDNKLSELSKPVAWLAIYHGDVYDEAISITRSVVEAQADRFGWESALTEITPLYSQEYVSALLAELERYKQYAKERDAENESLALTVGRLRAELEARLTTPARFPAAKDNSQGWTIDPDYLSAIAEKVGYSEDEGIPSMETVEAVLLATGFTVGDEQS